MARLSDAQKRLTAAQARKRRAALGPPLRLDDAAIATASVVGPADMPEVEAFTRATAGERGAALLEAR
jgi:hypothetical protein